MKGYFKAVKGNWEWFIESNGNVIESGTELGGNNMIQLMKSKYEKDKVEWNQLF